ncbi:MAG: peroxiredoxin [Planctomycetota bacterium]
METEAPNRTLIRKSAPPFRATAMVQGEFKEVSTSDYEGRYLVLFFYPLDFTFVCPTEILAFSDRLSEFEELNAAVVGVSVDSEYSHLAWWNTPREQGGIADVRLPLLADVSHSVARDYGVLLEEGLALRGLFVIDPQGIVRHQLVNDLPVGRSVDEALRVIQALRFHAEHGDVCPADWKPGERSMKADPAGSKTYFQQR